MKSVERVRLFYSKFQSEIDQIKELSLHLESKKQIKELNEHKANTWRRYFELKLKLKCKEKDFSNELHKMIVHQQVIHKKLKEFKLENKLICKKQEMAFKNRQVSKDYMETLLHKMKNF